MAKKLGIQVDDPDLESRLQRIESELEARALANIESSERAQLRSGLSSVREISGLRVETNVPGTIIVAWDDSRLRDLRYYEVEVANNPGFINNEASNLFSKSYKTTRPLFTFPDVFDVDATWYVRVRSVNSSGVKSNWSIPLSTEAGRAVKIDDETEVFSLTDPNPRGGIFAGPDSAFSTIQTITGHPNHEGSSAIYGSTNITWKRGLVLPFTILSYDTTSAWFTSEPPPDILIEILRVHDLDDYENNGPLLDQNYKIISTINLKLPITLGWGVDATSNPTSFYTLARQVITGFAQPDDIVTNASFIKPGTRIGYRGRLTVSIPGTQSSIYIRPYSITLYMVEVRV